VKIFEFGIKFGIEWCIQCSYLAKNNGKKFGQFRRNMTKCGQMLEKDSQPKDSNIFLNKIFFLKPE
jgi:hypothetical protein